MEDKIRHQAGHFKVTLEIWVIPGKTWVTLTWHIYKWLDYDHMNVVIDLLDSCYDIVRCQIIYLVNLELLFENISSLVSLKIYWPIFKYPEYFDLPCFTLLPLSFLGSPCFAFFHLVLPCFALLLPWVHLSSLVLPFIS